MIPVLFDPTKVEIALVGTGPLAVKRLRLLLDGGSRPVVYAPEADTELAALAGGRLHGRLPTGPEIAAAHLLFVAGLSDAQAEPLAVAARAAKTVVNVEDRLPFCDVHVPSIVRRGQLVLSVSTGGRSPALASLLRRWLERAFPPVWAERLDAAAALRSRMKNEGAGGEAIGRAVQDLAAQEEWLPS